MLNKTILAAAVLALALPVATIQAQDAMAGDAMASDSMAPMMSDDDLTLCIEQARAISFAHVAAIAEEACHAVHNGEPMETDAMAGDAMAGDAMAPQQ